MDDVFTLKKPREELTFSDLRHHFGTGCIRRRPAAAGAEQNGRGAV